MSQRILKVWNKTVTVTNAPDNITDDELIVLVKKKMLQANLGNKAS